MARPAAFAAGCGLLLAAIGWCSGGTSYGTGYEQARMLVEGQAGVPLDFPIWKLLATVVSYLSGIPGGIFAPSLSIGAASANGWPGCCRWPRSALRVARWCCSAWQPISRGWCRRQSPPR
nr:chloride channel protein [Pseudoroseomonas vastitatis]